MMTEFEKGMEEAQRLIIGIFQMSSEQRSKMFGNITTTEILTNKTIHEIKDTYNKYCDSINVGDEVTKGVKGSRKVVITQISGLNFNGIDENGANCWGCLLDVEKTGRSFPPIKTVLARMRGEDNESRKV